MKARTIRDGEKRLVRKNEYCCYIGLGESKAEEFAIKHNIKVKIGRACLYDLLKADSIINQLSESEGA